MKDDDGVVRLSRRAVLRGGLAAGAVALGGGAGRPGVGAAKRSAVGAPVFLQRPTLVFVLKDDDAAKVKGLLDDYSARHNVTIEVQPTLAAELFEKLTINLTHATGLYDVASIDDPWLPYFAGGEDLLNLGEMGDDLGLEPDPDFVPELLALGDFPAGSGLRAVPWVGNVQLFAWRVDVLEELGLEAPRTWDQVLTNAQAITDARGAAGLFGFGLPGQTRDPAATGFLPVLRGYGLDLFDAGWEPQLETPAAMAAIRTHLALAKLAPPGVENVGHDENGRDLYEGRVAQSANVWPDQMLSMFAPATSSVVGKVEVGAEPAQPGVRPGNLTGNRLLGIPEGSRHAEAAFEFIIWFTAPEQQKRLLLEQGLPATRTSVLQDPAATARFPVLPVLLAAARNAVAPPRTPHYGAIEGIFGRHVARALAGQVGGEQALREANTEMRSLLVREGVLEEEE